MLYSTSRFYKIGVLSEVYGTCREMVDIRIATQVRLLYNT